MESKQSNVVENTYKAIWDLTVLIFMTCYWYCEATFRIFIRPPLKSLDGEIVLITGAAGGIGREVCLLLAKTQVTLVCWDLNKEANDDLVNELKTLGCKAFSYKVDISDRSQVEATASKVKKEVGDVTILINNAGIMPCRRFLNQTPQELEKTYEINVFGQFWTLREFLPNMIAMNKGHIVTLCSAAGVIPIRNLAPYCGTKFAVNGFIESLKDELKHYETKPDIKFTTVYPFSCNTGLLSGIKSHSRFPWLINNVLEPEYVAQQLVEGLQRNYEHVYIPAIIKFAGTTAKALLPKVQYAATDFVQCYVEPSEEQKED